MDKKTDEKILDFINAREQAEKRRDICNGEVRISGIYYKFEKRDFFDEKLKIYIPNNFEDMSINDRKLKYPSENRPEIIKCNDDGSITFTLNIIESPLSEENVSELKDGMKMIIQRTNPANVFYEDGVIEVNEKNIGFFEFKSSVIDDFLYNVMFFLEFQKKTLMGTFSCRYKDYKEWRDVIFEILNKIEVIKEE